MDYFISTQLKRLKSPRADERIMGCDQLAAASDLPPLAVDLLEEAALLDSDPHVRQAANQALQAHRHPGVGNTVVTMPTTTDNQTDTAVPMTPSRTSASTGIPKDDSLSDKFNRILPIFYIPAIIVGIALFDWLFPASWAQDVLEREYPNSARWMVFGSFSREAQGSDWEYYAERGYLLMPESFLQAKVLIISTYNTPSSSSVNSSWDGLAFLFLICAYGFAYVNLVRKGNKKELAVD